MKINFTVGPVKMEEDILQIGGKQIPYFRTLEFSDLVKENESILKKLFEASEDSRIIALTTSGTGAMEASVMNCCSNKDKILIVNGGAFGERFVEICKIHKIFYEEIKLNLGKALKPEHLEAFEGRGFTGFLINMHETTTGVLYDMELVGNFCRRNHLFLVVDAISSFLADEVHMQKWGVNIMFTGSQKALALPPGMTMIALDGYAIQRVKENNCTSLYMDYKRYLLDGERGQTPFTPAVGILIQMNYRLKKIVEKGVENEINRVRMLANDFRNKIGKLPFQITSESLSNAITPLTSIENKSAYEICEKLKRDYNIWVCPSGGTLKNTLFRVGHLGALTIEDNDKLIYALTDMR